MRRVSSFIKEVGDITLLFLSIVHQMFTPPIKIQRIIEHMVEIGVNTLPIAAVMAIFTGMVLAVQAYHQFKQVNLEILVGSVVGISIVRELGPVLTAIIVAGRIGSATAAEIGSMKVSEQLDALRVLAVNPIRYLAVPRLWSALLMLPCLTIFTDFIGMIGGYIMGVFKFGIRSAIYIDKAIYFLVPWDIIIGLIKAFFFGIIIVTVGCYKGFTTSGGAEGVGKATTSAVVISSILILVSNYFLTVLLL